MKYFLLICTTVFMINASAQTNYALSFNGTDQYVSIGAPLSSNTSYTKEAWINVTTLANNQNIISSSGAPFWLSGGTLFAGHGGNYTSVGDVAPFPVNKWTHVAMTYNAATTTMRLYRDGILVNSNTAVASNYTSENCFIGSHTGGNSIIQGSVDEVRIWNLARTQAELKNNMYRAPANNEPGLVAYYKTNDGSGTVLTNSTGGTNGTLVNAPLWVASPVQYSGNALNFDGTNDVISIPSNATLDITNAITIEAWVYATKNSGIQNVICKSTNVNNNGYIFPRTDNGWTRVVIYFHIAGGWRTLDAPYPSINAWHHLAATYDGATIRLYINGVEAASLPQTGAITTNGNALAFGEQTGFAERFEGSMDEVRIWNVARTQAQIQTHMSMQFDPVPQTGLVSYYSFNQGVSSGTNTGLTTITDMKSQNNGTLTGFALSGASSNFLTQNAVLPLQWHNFTAQEQHEKISLSWSTASEQNTREFIIQHSGNGTEWNKIGVVAAAGNNNAIIRYNYLHATPAMNMNYYRIMQTDKDGRYSYSEIRTVKFNAGGVSFTILKNPVENGTLHVKLSKAANLSFVSIEGKVLWQKYLSAGTFAIPANGFATGIYFLKSNGQTEEVILR